MPGGGKSLAKVHILVSMKGKTGILVSLLFLLNLGSFQAQEIAKFVYSRFVQRIVTEHLYAC